MAYKRSAMQVAYWLLVVGALLLHGAQAAQYNVGGDAGWSLSVNFTAWAEKYEYLLGDSLFFKYTSQKHSVLQVNKEDFKACNIGNALFVDDKGDTTFPLTTAGQYWFICGVSTHCSQGMNFTVNVLSSASTTPSPGPSTPDSASNIINPTHLLSFLIFLIPLAFLLL